MFVYADTSAILAVLVEGPGTPLAVRVWDGAAAVACSRLIDVELVAELTRAVHGGDLDGADGVRALAAWRRYRVGVRWVEVDEALTAMAATIALEQELSTAAAVHVASALRCAGRSATGASAPAPGAVDSLSTQTGGGAAALAGPCALATIDPLTARAARNLGVQVLTPPASTLTSTPFSRR